MLTILCSAICQRASLLHLLALSALSQTTFPLAGTVTNAATNEPLPRARVVATRISGPTDFEKAAFTDATGAFRFPALPAGRYALRVQKPRFETKSPIPIQPIELSAPIENLAYSLVPYGAISGQLLDAVGEPLPLVHVQLYRQIFFQGLPATIRAGGATTDDRGRFRLPNLPAGRYFVRALSRAGGAFLSGDESAPSSVGRRAFAPVYAGNAEQIAQATPTDLAPGQEAQVNFRLSLHPAYRIRGAIAGLRPGIPIHFELRLPGAEPIEPRVFLNPASGVFTIFDLLPASYHLRVRHGDRAEQLAAEATVTAGPDPTPPLLLQVQPPSTITLQSEGPGALPCGSVLYTSAFPSVLPIALQHGRPVSVPAGEYHILTNCFDAAVESIRLGPTDLLLSRRLTMAIGAPPATLTITRSSQAGTLTVNRTGAAILSPVLLIPGSEALGGPQLLEATSLPRAVVPLRAGAYTVHALPTANLPYRDPVFLSTLRGGVAVRVETGQSTAVALTEITRP